MKTFTRAAALLTTLLALACSAGTNPAAPTTQAPLQSLVPAPAVLTLGQPVDVRLSNQLADTLNCEIGIDPVPCQRFAIDAPRAGTLRIEMQFADRRPMFMYLYREVSGNVADLQSVADAQSPLVAQSVVDAGRVYLHAGLNVPWAHGDGTTPVRLLATLQ
jgi:hypothetical protein